MGQRHRRTTPGAGSPARRLIAAGRLDARQDAHRAVHLSGHAPSVPIGADNSGQVRLPGTVGNYPNQQKSTGQSTFGSPRTVDSQAQSASSILVTRPMKKPQASGRGLSCCSDRPDHPVSPPRLAPLPAVQRPSARPSRPEPGFKQHLQLQGESNLARRMRRLPEARGRSPVTHTSRHPAPATDVDRPRASASWRAITRAHRMQAGLDLLSVSRDVGNSCAGSIAFAQLSFMKVTCPGRE